MVTKITVIIYAVLSVLCAIAYLPKLRQLFYASHRLPRKTAAVKRKISVVIPARDESEVIADLLSSIGAQDYDRAYFGVNVIVNDPADPTIGIAESFGAKVFVVPDQKCKGDALDGYFRAEEKEIFESYDAFVIVDADAMLSPDYLTELNNALEYDADIVLSRKFIKNFLGDRKDRTVFSNCSALTYAQLDDLGNIYRTDHGIPMNMCGQGMMIRRETIEQLGGWPYRTLTEDYEMRMDCFLKGFRSMYYPYAIVYTEEPLRHRENYERRLRWVTGFSQCDKMYKKKIKAQAKARGKATEGEFEYFYSLVPLIAFIVVTVLTALAGVVISVYNGVTGADGWVFPLLLLVVTPLCVIYLLLLIYAAMCLHSMRDTFCAIPLGDRVATALFMPFYGLEYFPIFIQSRIKARYGWDWKPTKHIRYKGTLRIRKRGTVAEQRPTAQSAEKCETVSSPTNAP